MASYNVIQFTDVCPVCNQRVEIAAQTYVAADESFMAEWYKLGEKLPWYDDDAGWASDPTVVTVSPGVVRQACYARCNRCTAELVVVLEFVDRTPTRVISIAASENWPEGYPR